ncbi:hypothetical protein GDI3860 [Gluconacetobacter diazotrophicus PA1 5]|uniref:Uncharacterized protein n=1 Tax=Gluconacetobacter diazotrophicus (strain ATCC 49037 / DSM 5601 / CCUG 37298 / CIP 103539 / LMG 7603 / PAl5) TaxID=272568 RepID=A9HA72_GLUDA|nr:hypothetical protein GDI3860 [Gluconacetobacter diazotrophicus PA1 5]
MTLVWSGCRLSEALALSADRVDLAAGVLVFESLKKRQAGVYRAVPVSPALLDALDLVHGIRQAQKRRDRGQAVRLWPWARMTGWRAVHAVMQEAGFPGRLPRPRGCATPSASPPSPMPSPSTWSRNGSATPSSPRPPSTPMPSAPRNRISHAECGDNRC